MRRSLTARSKSLAAIAGRCIARLGATPDFHYGLLKLLPGALLALAITAHAGSQAGPGADAGGTRIWNGVYTAAQVDQAKKPLVAVCRRCHSDDLGGSDRGPSLHGPKFMATWETQELSALFAKVRDTMPPDSPSSLPDEDYINMVALILQKNGFPAGNETLSANKLDGILIVGKDASERGVEFSPGRSGRLFDARAQRRVDVDPHQSHPRWRLSGLRRLTR